MNLGDVIFYVVLSLVLGMPVLYVMWLIIVKIIALIYDLNPKCPACGRKIIQDDLGFSPKFSCLCGVRGVVSINWFWVNTVTDWVSPKNREEVKTS